MANSAPMLSVVAPCFDEAASLPELHRRVAASCRDVVGSSYEIVLVNDGSRDGTWQVIRALAEKDTHVVGVDLSRNHGHQLALTAGLTLCRGQRILIIDADLQDPPELLPRMFELMDEGADIVYGKRLSRPGESWFKRWTARTFYRLMSQLTEVEIPLDTGDFRILSRRALDVLLRMPEQHRFIRGMVSWIGYKQVPILYDRAERQAGATKYPVGKMVRFALDGITGFSIRPLRLATYLGLLMAVGALVSLVYTVFFWLVLDTVQGWTSLVAVMLILGSVQMLFLGLMGEYLGRLFIEAKRRPLFVISDVVRSGEPRAGAEPPAEDEPTARP